MPCTQRLPGQLRTSTHKCKVSHSYMVAKTTHSVQHEWNPFINGMVHDREDVFHTFFQNQSTSHLHPISCIQPKRNMPLEVWDFYIKWGSHVVFRIRVSGCFNEKTLGSFFLRSMKVSYPSVWQRCCRNILLTKNGFLNFFPYWFDGFPTNEH